MNIIIHAFVFPIQNKALRNKRSIQIVEPTKLKTLFSRRESV